MLESLQCNSNIPLFTYDELNFGELLGKGLYGKVYEGRCKGVKIAIKVLIPNDFQNVGAKKSFTSEIHTLGLIQHINLVRLLGYCIRGLDHMLVYEYMSKKSLDEWLSDDKHLNWKKRTSIIIGIVQGLTYLHHECNPTIIHLDIKPGNILLDEDYTPKLADFGLAKILNGTNENVVCAFPFFLFFINTYIDSSFEIIVIENKFKNKLKFLIDIALPLLWIL
jgi:serine/threonine protein kinase